MNRCGVGQCAMHFVGRGGGGGTSWLMVMDSIALWIVAVAAVLFLLGLRRRPWGRGGQARGRAAYQSQGGAPGNRVWGGWGPGPGSAAQPHLAQAEATLAERFSRGEITADEYRGGIDLLRGQGNSQSQAAQSQSQTWPQAQPQAPQPQPQAQPEPEPPTTES